MNKLFSILVIFFCLHLSADDSFDRDDQKVSEALQLMTKHQVLDEIERLKGEIDELVQVGRISSSTALAVSAALSTIVYGVTVGGVSGANRDGVIDVMQMGALLSLFPGLGLGGLLGFMNSAPSVPVVESFWLSFRSVIFTIGFWMTGNAGMLIWSVFIGIEISKINDAMAWSGMVMIPIHAYTLYSNIINRLEERKDQLFDLEFRLNEARNYLNSKPSEIEPETEPEAIY